MGTYDIKVIVKGSAGATDEIIFQATTYDKYTNISVIATGDFKVGDTLFIKGNAVCGIEPYTFAYFYKLSTKNSWNKITDGYVEETQQLLKFGKAGTYDILVSAKDASGQVEQKRFSVVVS